MATILRGNRKGEQVEIHQFCNDWFDVGAGVVLSPVSLRLDPEEIERVVRAARAGQVGTMFEEYHLRPNGTFIRNRQSA